MTPPLPCLRRTWPRILTAILAGACLLPSVVMPAPAASAQGNPLSGPLYVQPGTRVAAQVRAWRRARPADAGELAKIASQPRTVWLGDWNTNVRSDVAATVRAAGAVHRLPVLVAYNLPGRDCGGFSRGGAASGRAYRAWIRSFAAGIGAGPAAVILEPDALAELECLSRARQRTYLSLLDYAIGSLAAHPGVAVYVDAGNSSWHSAAVMARRLRQLRQLTLVRGFALNVSSFRTTKESLAYGDDIAARLGAKHFVLDTSRNGLGPAPGDQWCNPPGRALGPRPTAATGDPAADAFLWIKAPGESDGRCGGGPAAGHWWPDYALGLARRAGF